MTWGVFGVGFAIFCLIERRPVVSAILQIAAVGSGLAWLVVDDSFMLYPVISGVFAVILAAANKGRSSLAEHLLTLKALIDQVGGSQSRAARGCGFGGSPHTPQRTEL